MPREDSVSFCISFPRQLLNDLDAMRGDVRRSDFLQNLVRKEKKEIKRQITLTPEMLKPQLL